MSLEQHLTEAFAENDNPEIDVVDVSAREIRILLTESAIRSEVYEKASLDPIAGDDLSMVTIHAVMDALIEALS